MKCIWWRHHDREAGGCSPCKEKLQTSDVFSLTKNSCYWRKVSLFEIQQAEWFYMTKRLSYKMPLASLERRQMYKDDLFLDFNCLIIPAALKRSRCIKLISLLAKPVLLRLGLSHILLTFSSSLSLSRTKKPHGRLQRMSFPPRND